jgi:7-keto-8-aminopelargonate synthetase-like enzyme
VEALRDLAREFDAELFVDDAHGVFCVGPHGRGCTELCGLEPHDTTLLGSMSKALGVNGGFLAGCGELVDAFRRSDAASGSAIPPPPIAAACLEALRIVGEEPGLRKKLDLHAARMRQVLAKHGIGIHSDRTPIIAMTLADAEEARRLAEHFLAHDILIPHFTYASEPRHNLLRSVARACYTDAELSRFEGAVAAWQAR